MIITIRFSTDNEPNPEEIGWIRDSIQENLNHRMEVKRPRILSISTEAPAEWHAHPHDPNDPPARCPCCGQVCEGRTLYPPFILTEELWAAIRARMYREGLIQTGPPNLVPRYDPNQWGRPFDPNSTAGQR